jgi:hypothetical protein
MRDLLALMAELSTVLAAYIRTVAEENLSELAPELND